ncbi:hypothetical protein ABZ915_47650 [Streptomyces sp. NPDC046915]|uniref:hypothetical protein n=1 Tax=Streptomyces sp. NPDC046915 TaxID=3155257 RepID=UPI0033DE8D98
MLGVVGVIESAMDSDGPPACAKQWAGVRGVSNADANLMVECDDEIDKWCAKHHPEDPDDCSNNITIDGDDRNVGKN